MRRHRNRNGENVLLDLTPLLDVVFIILFVMFCNYKSASAKSADYASEAETSKKLYDQAAETIGSQLVISVTVPFDEDSVETRHIEMLVKGVNNDEPDEFCELKGSDVEEGWNAFAAHLDELAAEYDGEDAMPVIIGFNEGDEDILYRDEKKMQEVLTDLAQKHGNVYLKFGTAGE